jgi:hypothetical protein
MLGALSFIHVRIYVQPTKSFDIDTTDLVRQAKFDLDVTLFPLWSYASVF